jgi:hypothetical protein
MKLGYAVALLIAAGGVCLIILSVSESEHVSLLGLTFHPSVARGAGLISLLLSLVAGLVAYGSSLPPGPVERRRH